MSDLSTQSSKEIETNYSMRLRELEIYTKYELKYLSDAFKDLKTYVEESLRRESDKFDNLSRKVNWLTVVILAQMAGINIDLLMKVFKVVPL